MSASDVLTPRQVAVELQLGESTVYRGLESGEIPGEKVCNRWRTLRSQLLDRVRDGRVPAPRANADPMPSRRQSRGDSVRAEVIELRRTA